MKFTLGSTWEKTVRRSLHKLFLDLRVLKLIGGGR